MEKKTFHAFTTRYNGVATQLINKVQVSQPFDPRNTTQPLELLEVTAIWDTGATGNVITSSLARQLNLKPISIQRVRGVTGEKDSNEYMVNIVLPNNVSITYTRVLECEDILGDASILIGMSIISLGDFSVTNVNAKTALSFRFPSIKEIDYVLEANKENARIKLHGNESKKEAKSRRKRERQDKKKGRRR